MAEVTTLPELWRPLMDAPNIITPWCAVCGKTGHLEQHHMVKRSTGQLVLPNGAIAEKPTITLCGHGNADGCHGLAHQGRLHFRWVRTRYVGGTDDFYADITGGHLEYLLTDRPVDYLTALSRGGWRRLRKSADWGA